MPRYRKERPKCRKIIEEKLKGGITLHDIAYGEFKHRYSEEIRIQAKKMIDEKMNAN